MKTAPALAALLSGAALALALACGTPATRSALPVLAPGDTDPALGYESPPIQHASDLLPAALLRGPHYQVRDEVTSDGFLRHYQVDSDWGEIHVEGDALLAVLLQELRALGAIEEARADPRFAQVLDHARQVPMVSRWKLVDDPPASPRGVPDAAWIEVDAIAETPRRLRSDTEQRTFSEFVGFERAKRRLAEALAVDPYSTNAALQRGLNQVAWAIQAGDLPPERQPRSQAAAGAPDDGVIDPFAQGDERLNRLLAEEGPEDLRRLNRIELTVMGIDEPLVEAFLAHPLYTPRSRTIIVAALQHLDGAEGRADLIRVSLGASSASDALFYQRAAEMLREIDARVSRVQRIDAPGTVARAWLADGRRVTPLGVDQLIWTRPTDQLVTRAAALDAEQGTTARRELWFTGDVSPRARAGLEARGVVVVERAFEALPPRPTPVAESE